MIVKKMYYICILLFHKPNAFVCHVSSNEENMRPDILGLSCCVNINGRRKV